MTLNLPHDKALHIIVGVLVYAIFHFISPMAGMTIVVIAAVGTVF
jgi:type III secretory pathway component EscU